ncbi:MAG TPA: PASTA domain-containing protein [Mycobacteriales bacterium]|jgi:Uncharacterized protein conserved in bacteria
MGIRPVVAVLAWVLVTGLALTGCRDTGLGVAAGPSAASAAPAASNQVLTMPDVTGQRLSQARDVLSDLGFDNVSVHDATGRDRPVIIDQNWVVRAQTPAAGTRGDARTRITLTVSKPTDGISTSPPTVGVVPDVVCLDLQHAQDALQAAGFDNLGSQDGTGQGRAQIVDRNWVVTGQSARAGGRPAADTRIVLTAVKFGEPTGESGCQN